MTLSSWADFPVHRSANWIAHVATSDRNFYDRYSFDAFDTCGEFMCVMGLGRYPNLGTTDAFVTVRVGDEQHIVRASRTPGDRADMRIGPLRLEVLEPLRRLRFVCEPTAHTVACDLTWEGCGPAIPEPNQFIRPGARVTLDTHRLAQMGSWNGTLEVGGRALAVDASTTSGSRDRSWGVRPVGEKEPDGIAADGSRSLEQAQRVWLDARIEELGRTDHRHEFVDGMRLLRRSTSTRSRGSCPGTAWKRRPRGLGPLPSGAHRGWLHV